MIDFLNLCVRAGALFHVQQTGACGAVAGSVGDVPGDPETQPGALTSRGTSFTATNGRVRGRWRGAWGTYQGPGDAGGRVMREEPVSRDPATQPGA